jgi:hypothetical protein
VFRLERELNFCFGSKLLKRVLVPLLLTLATMESVATTWKPSRTLQWGTSVTIKRRQSTHHRGGGDHPRRLILRRFRFRPVGDAARTARDATALTEPTPSRKRSLQAN